MIFSPDDKQCRCLDPQQRVSRQIRSATAGNDGGHILGMVGRRQQRGAGTGTRAEIADFQCTGLWILLEPIRHISKSLRQQLNIKTQMSTGAISNLFLCC